MIKVTSANDGTDFFINHRKINVIRQLEGDNLYVILDSGKPFIIKDTIDNLKEKVIEFENSIIFVEKKENKKTEEVLGNE